MTKILSKPHIGISGWKVERVDSRYCSFITALYTLAVILFIFSFNNSENEKIASF